MFTTIAVLIGLVALDLIVYAPVRHFGFISYDDPLYVSENANIVHGLTAKSIAWAFTTGRAANWHPLTWLSLLLDVSVFGVNAPAHHLVNVALHVADTLLLFWLLLRTTGSTWRSAFVAALFGVHPLHVESVAWISERKDVLSTLFMWLTMLAYVGYTKRPGVARYLVVAVMLALGLMSKPMLVTLPLVLLLMDVWPLRRLPVAPLDLTALWKLAIEKVPLFGLVLVSAVVTFIVQRHGGAMSGFDAAPPGLRLINAAVAYVRYLWLALWPARLTMFYPFPSWLSIPVGAAAAAALAAVTIFALRNIQKAPYIAVGWLWYLITLVPVIGLVQVGIQSMADRYSYTPLVGIFIIVAWTLPGLLARWPLRRTVLSIAAGIILIACTVTARAQVRYWSDTTTAWEHAIAVAPDSFVAHDALGSQLIEHGQLDAGIAHLRAALAITTTFADTYYNLGVGLMKKGQTAEARSLFLTALERRPTNAEAHCNLGLLDVGEHKIDEGIAEYRAAIAADPDLAGPYNNLGAALASRGDLSGATSAFREAIRLKPDLVNAHYQLGLALATQGSIDGAMSEYDTVLRLDPTFAAARNDRGFVLFGQGHTADALADYDEAIRLRPDLASAWNNRGFLRATQRAMPEAISDFREAIRLDPSFASAHMNLGLALGGTGHTAEAIREFQTALRLDPTNDGARRALRAAGS